MASREKMTIGEVLEGRQLYESSRKNQQRGLRHEKITSFSDASLSLPLPLKTKKRVTLHEYHPLFMAREPEA